MDTNGSRLTVYLTLNQEGKFAAFVETGNDAN
jgi:hypothetical protein